MGFGTRTGENDLVTLAGMGLDSLIINQFHLEFHLVDNHLIWNEDGSVHFIYIKLQDGAIFNPAE